MEEEKKVFNPDTSTFEFKKPVSVITLCRFLEECGFELTPELEEWALKKTRAVARHYDKYGHCHLNIKEKMPAKQKEEIRMRSIREGK